MSKKLWIIFALSCVVAAGLVVYGVLTHEEPGLRRSDVTWSKGDLPLVVQEDPYVMSDDNAEDARKMVGSVIKTINNRLGFKILEHDNSKHDHQIHITIGVPQDASMDVPADFDGMTSKDPGGAFRLSAYPGGKIWQFCKIQTSNTGTDGILHDTLYHELGHCLGLEDDDYETSIMYPIQKEWTGNGFPPHISDWDRDILRKLYSP